MDTHPKKVKSQKNQEEEIANISWELRHLFCLCYKFMKKMINRWFVMFPQILETLENLILNSVLLWFKIKEL